MVAELLLGKTPKEFYGSGSGYGDGYGDGYGSGSGDGSGDGYGSGYGYGSGSGYGDSYGDSYGDCDGDGSGSGYGDSYGDCDGDGSYWLSAIKYFSERWTPAQRSRLEELQGTAKIAYWRSDSSGLPVNGGRSNAPVNVGLVQTAGGPLKICKNGFHATEIPPKWKGERLWVVALIGEVQQEDDKFCALTREIIGECL